MSKSLFIIGTGTDVGKTYVSGLILKKLRESGASAAYYKAAMSGNERGGDGVLIPGDALWVKEHSGIRPAAARKCVPLSMKQPFPRIWPPAWRAIRWILTL